MKLTSMQFDGDGGYDTPLNSGTTASVGSDKDYKDSAGETVTPAAPVEAASETNARNNAKAETATRMAGMGSPSALAAQESGQIGATSIATRMKAMGASAPSASTGVAKSEKAKAPIDKSKWDRSIKVSQSTVDAVKDAGRGNMGAKPQGQAKLAPTSPEYKEAVKRIYPNGAPSDKPAAKKSPSFNESSPNGKAFPKIAAPKTKLETVKKLRNAEIEEANKTAPDGKFTAAVINAAKGGMEAYGAGTQNRYQIPGTQTKTQKAQAAAKAERATAVAAAKKK